MAKLESDYKAELGDMFAYIGFESERHEDKQTNYIADMSFSGNRVDGWVEVKWCDEDPPSLGALTHWTKGQEAWLVDRGRVGSGHSYLLLGTPHRHFLWRYDQLAAVRNLPFERAIFYCCCSAPNLSELAGFFKNCVRR